MVKSHLAQTPKGTMEKLAKATHYLSKAEGTSSKAVVLIHEWWGLTDLMKTLADRFALQGYHTLAIDLFDGKTTEDPAQASKWMAADDPETSLAKLREALLWLHEGPLKIKSLATVGWCFGGGYSLKCALQMPELVQASVIYYGLVETHEEKLKNCGVPLLGVFAEQDQWITPERFRQFEKACRSTGVSLEMHVYDAEHAFANSHNPQYHQEYAQDAEQKVFAFLKKVLSE